MNNKNFNVERLITISTKNIVDMKTNCGWDNAYSDVPGSQSFIDGVYIGAYEGYKNAIGDVFHFIKNVFEKNPQITVSEILKMF